MTFGTRKNVFLGLVASLVVLSASSATGRDYTPNLRGFVTNGDVDLAAFDDYSAQLASAVAPRFLGPAGTLGYNGFEFSFAVGLSGIDKSMDYWDQDDSYLADHAEDPGSLFITNQIRLRKGLPYSFQVAGTVTTLYNSSIWHIGLEIGWSIVEGMKYAPDLAVVGSIGTMLGTNDYLMLSVNPAVLLSKSFGVAGMFSLAPYLGYNLLYVNASTHLFETWLAAPTVLAVDPRNILRHRLVIGIEAVITHVTVGGEILVDMQSGQVGSGLKLGTMF